MDSIEECLGAIILKIDGVFRKLNISEQDRARKRAAMDSIFNAGDDGVQLQQGELEEYQRAEQGY